MKICLYYNALIVMYVSCTGSNVIPIQRDENCVFRAVLYCINNTEDRHSGIRLSPG